MAAPNRINNFGRNVANVFANAPDGPHALPPAPNAANAPPRMNNFGQNVATVFANAPNAPAGAPLPVRPGNARNFPNAPPRINNFGQNVENLFEGAPPAVAQRMNNFGQDVTNLFQNAPAGPQGRIPPTQEEIYTALKFSTYVTGILERLSKTPLRGGRRRRNRRTVKQKSK
jgi:hypothetical protein